ncbi:MAG TPA: hypothetical protein VGC92_10935 [Phenylobacterium sp.]
MRITLAIGCAAVLAMGSAAPCVAAQDARPAQAPAPGHYRNFRVAIYVTVDSTRRLADRATFDREFDRAQRQTRFDKVYVEAYRDHRFATDEELARVKAWFQEKGIQVAGGVTLAKGGIGGQFGTFDYEAPADRAECEQAVRLAARHFDEIILDDFFFYATKSDADIAAKGARSWTRYRLDKMHEVARDLVLGPAKQTNPRAKVIIKFPNWYEHFQGTGFDLDQEPKMFDGIYTGTETRDPQITDQLLQQYESYEVYRYFSNISPGRNGGGWVDTFDTRYVDRYAEQLWATIFAKAPEITLFNWSPMTETQPVLPGERAAWAGKPTSFDWDEMVRGYRSAGPGDPGPGWGQAAGYSLARVDAVAGKLGRPIGIASYKPYQSSGEDFLHSYLGNIGLPIELTPNFPTEAPTVLLTEAAKADPRILEEIKGQLTAGKTVVITSGLLRALQGKGIEDVVEVEYTGRKAAIRDFVLGFGAGNGSLLSDPEHPTPPVLFPEIRFFTNDSWGIIRGVAGNKGYPILLMNRYSKGVLMILAVPDNPGDLYNLPPAVLSQIKAFVQGDFPVRIEADPQVALYAYDNGAVVVQSFRPTDSAVTLVLSGDGRTLRDEQTGAPVAGHPPAPPPATRRVAPLPPQTRFEVSVPPHSFRVFRIGG